MYLLWRDAVAVILTAHSTLLTPRQSDEASRGTFNSTTQSYRLRLDSEQYVSLSRSRPVDLQPHLITVTQASIADGPVAQRSGPPVPAS